MKLHQSTIAIHLLVLVALLLTTTADAGNTNAISRDAKIKIILVGDSTVTDNAGWGLGFKQFLNPDKAECVNTSQGGRSSESFRREGRWTNALALKGNYYLIQFGHNNEPGKPGRSTDMPTFVSNMVSYVEEAQAIGAKPVLVTPLTRRQWDKDHPGKIKSSLAPYAEDVRKIAAEKHVPLVDLQARSIELCESLGPEKCLEFSPPKFVDGTNTGGYDGTHLNEKGHVLFARLVVDEIARPRRNSLRFCSLNRSTQIPRRRRQSLTRWFPLMVPGRIRRFNRPLPPRRKMPPMFFVSSSSPANTTVRSSCRSPSVMCVSSVKKLKTPS